MTLSVLDILFITLISSITSVTAYNLAVSAALESDIQIANAIKTIRDAILGRNS